jgi:hypothetical protein
VKALIAQLGRSAQGALADNELGDEILRTLRSGANNTTTVAANDCHHLGKAHVYTAEDEVQFREDRERLDREKWPKLKYAKKRQPQR